MTENANGTNEIIMIVDRSGSMGSWLSDAHGGINTFLRTEQDRDPKTRLTYCHFDTEYEILHDGVEIGTVKELPLVPRGATALLDAVGRTLAQVEERHRTGEKPAKVFLMVVTDGHENSSREFTKKTVQESMARVRAAGWEVNFLGADVDAFAEAGAMGVSLSNTAQMVKKGASIRAAMGYTGQNVGDYFSGTSSSTAYTTEQKTEIEEAE